MRGQLSKISNLQRFTFNSKAFPSGCVKDPSEQSAGIFPAVLELSLGFKERSKASLPEVMICRKSFANPELVHNSETDAIGERPLFVAMFAEPVGRDVETCRINPFEAECLTAFDRIKEVRGGTMAVARQQQSDGFVGHIFGSEEMATFSD